MKNISRGIIVSIIALCVIFAFNKDAILAQICLYETMPNYRMDSSVRTAFKFNMDAGEGKTFAEDDPTAFSMAAEEAWSSSAVSHEPAVPQQPADFHVDRIEEIPVDKAAEKLIGIDDIILQPETDSANIDRHFHEEMITFEDIDKLKDISYLRNKFYTVDRRTEITPDLFNAEAFLSRNLRIDNTGESPKILIFHTHSEELYADSTDKTEGVIGAGEELSRILNKKYGIVTLHHFGEYDVIDGKSDRNGAYERMEPEIQDILSKNPSIEIAIDLHRDGVPEHTRLVNTINGKSTAQIMFFNGTSKIFQNGALVNIKSLPNENLPSNLAFSFQMQLTANKLYPGFTRKVYLNAYRYSLHMLPRSLLVEVGAQNNTKEEAYNAMEPLADVLAQVVLGGK